MNGNLDILAEVQDRIMGLDTIVDQRYGTDEYVSWEVISVSRVKAEVKAITGHKYVLELAAILAEQADSWIFHSPPQFYFRGECLPITITLHEREEGATDGQ